jgi:CBS domain-containing membrane protein
MSDESRPRRPGREDYERALRSMDTFVDIDADDLMTLAERAEHFAGQRAAEALSIRRVMGQPVHVVHPDTQMSEAAHLMVRERISGLPVVDEGGRLVGLITEADFLRGLGVPAHHPTQNLWQTLESLFHHLAHHAELEGPDDPVSKHMVRDLVCARPDQSLHQALALMKRHCVKRLPVCDQKRQVLGMITRSDLVRIFFDRYTSAARSEGQ